MANTINLGLVYGMGKIKLASERGLDRPKANALFAEYHAQVPFVKQLSLDLIQFAEQHKLLFTLEDRFCRFNKWEIAEWNAGKLVPPTSKADAEAAYFLKYPKATTANIRRAMTYKALNKLIQGSAADMTKQAMLDLYREGIVPHIQIHDELDISVIDKKQSDRIIEIMEKAVTLKIPNKVDYESGDNWGEING